MYEVEGNIPATATVCPIMRLRRVRIWNCILMAGETEELWDLEKQ